MTQQDDIYFIKNYLDNVFLPEKANEAFQRILDRTLLELPEHYHIVRMMELPVDKWSVEFKKWTEPHLGTKVAYGKTPREAVLNALKGIKDESL